MSGTAYGTVVLHVAPEAAAEGPLARLRTGDFVVLDIDERRIDVDVPSADFDARPSSPAMIDGLARPRRGWEDLYVRTVMGADTGADLDFLVGASGHDVGRESH
jgi:dihydroxy-acid dehydratase